MKSSLTSLHESSRDWPQHEPRRLQGCASELAAALLRQLFLRYPGSAAIRAPHVIAGMVLGRASLSLAEAYCRGDVEVEGDFYAALKLKEHLERLQIPLRDRPAAVIQARRLWLGPNLVYSCAYYDESADGLEEAQRAKLDYVCRKLLLRPNERFLDIGCGWGALLIHAASQYGIYGHGITLSDKQLGMARQRIAEAGLTGRVTVERGDYRELPADSFDKVASVGAYEHVGLKNLPSYFAAIHRALRSGGLFLNEGRRLYLSACAVEVDSGSLAAYQILTSKRRAAREMPLTRSHLCTGSNPPREVIRMARQAGHMRSFAQAGHQ